MLADIQLADGSSGLAAVNEIPLASISVPVIFITAYPERLLTGEKPEPDVSDYKTVPGGHGPCDRSARRSSLTAERVDPLRRRALAGAEEIPPDKRSWARCSSVRGGKTRTPGGLLSNRRRSSAARSGENQELAHYRSSLRRWCRGALGITFSPHVVQVGRRHREGGGGMAGLDDREEVARRNVPHRYSHKSRRLSIWRASGFRI